MMSRRGTWATLWTRLATDSRFDLAGLRQASLRREVAARMRLHGAATYEEYLHLLATRRGEFAALAGALRSQIYQSHPAPARAWRAPARQWVDALPGAALLAEAVPATGGLRLVAHNRLADDLLAAPEVVLHAAGSRHQWLLPGLEPCAEGDMPLHRAIWHGTPTQHQILLLRDGAGCLQALAVCARRVAGAGPRRAMMMLHPSDTWDASDSSGTLLAHFNEAQALAARYRHIFAENAAALLVTSPDGLIEEANEQAEHLLGAAHGAAGSMLAAHLAEAAGPELQQALRRACDDGEAGLRLHSRHGRVVQASARRLEVGAETRLQWALRDVTTEVEAEQRRNNWTDLALHDMRSPLATAILGAEASVRVMQRGDLPRAERSLAMAQAALRRLSRLIDSLLDSDRLEAGRMGLRRAQVRVGELVAEVAAEAALAIESHNLRQALDVAPGLPDIFADRDMLFRAVSNLLDNAIRFSPPGGCISLRAAVKGEGLAISVGDQGPGIAPELQPRIFDKLIGLDLPQAPRGYGLGLAFCKLAVEAHGGRVAVDSAPGRGSTFTLWLPTGGADAASHASWEVR